MSDKLQYALDQSGPTNTFPALIQKVACCQVCAWERDNLLTWVLKVDIIAVVGIFQLVGHHPESHDLLAD